MDTLKNKTYPAYNYRNRYTEIPNYFDTIYKREVPGIGHNMKKNSPWVAHEVKTGDTLDALSLKYYANPIYWWVIAYFNDIQDAFIDLATHYTILKIPAISSIEFGDER